MGLASPTLLHLQPMPDQEGEEKERTQLNSGLAGKEKVGSSASLCEGSITTRQIAAGGEVLRP